MAKRFRERWGLGATCSTDGFQCRCRVGIYAMRPETRELPRERTISEREGGAYGQINTTSWEDARRVLQSFGRDWVFRGHEQESWRLRTSLERETFELPREVAEQRMLNEIQRRAHHFVSPVHIPSNTVEWLALMQHHGAPTRLLDWTRSPFVCGVFCRRECRRVLSLRNLSTATENPTVPPIENPTDRRGDEPQVVATS
jgi:hypothetical protein